MSSAEKMMTVGSSEESSASCLICHVAGHREASLFDATGNSETGHSEINLLCSEVGGSFPTELSQIGRAHV